MTKNKLAFSIDLDEWYHCRWATGYEHSIWKDTTTLFKDHYSSKLPIGDLLPPTEWLLELFTEKNVKVTFFILGEVAQWYPELVKKIADHGHEIACHGMHHNDMNQYSREEFKAKLKESKNILEDITGQKIKGYRAPNLVVEPYLADVLEELDFEYDSSICPSRGIKGKYGDMENCSQHPYKIGKTIQQQGNRNLWELPIPTMPLFKLPACTGVATRVFGLWWTRFTLRHWIKSGHVQYYFHPYETWFDKIPSNTLYVKIFMMNRGKRMQRRVRKLLDVYKGRVTSLHDLIKSGLEGGK